jgi:hypothetical protein
MHRLGSVLDSWHVAAELALTESRLEPYGISPRSLGMLIA